MFVKLAVIACSVAVALAAWNGPLAGGLPAAQYPAGVSPEACPNFPHCTNPALSANPSAPAPRVAPHYNQAPAAYNQGYNQRAYAQAAYNPAPAAYNQGAYNQGAYNQAPAAYNQGAYNPAPASYSNNALDNGEYTGDGDYKGEGLAESGAFGQVNYPAAQGQAAYNGGYNQGAYNAAPAYNHGTYQAAPAAHGHAAQVPAGVDPNSCPNYPFCS